MDRGIYGKVALLRGKCLKCKEKAFVIDGKYQCCGLRAKKPKNIRSQKMTQGREKREHWLKKKEKRAILKEQSNQCYYCKCDLVDSWYMTHKTKSPKKIQIHYDHIVPWAYSRDDSIPNIVATCNLCNLYKHSKVFGTFEDLMSYLTERREKKGVIIL